jgi:hypothetical protein
MDSPKYFLKTAAMSDVVNSTFTGAIIAYGYKFHLRTALFELLFQSAL